MRFVRCLVMMSALICGCCYIEEYAENAALADETPVQPETRSGRFLLGVAVSGGGSRSAVFAANVLEFLWMSVPQGFPPYSKLVEKGQNLVDEVDYLSGCSGGSLASLYYCMKRPALLNGSFFENFRNDMGQDFETRATWCDLLRVVLLQSYRSQNLANIWDRSLFGDKKFADLKERESRGLAPTLIMNAASLGHNTRFLFANENLDYLKGRDMPDDFLDFRAIRSDIDPYSLSLATCASAAAPGLFMPVALIDHASSDRKYLHLVDGSIADNTAARILFQIFRHRLESDPKVCGALILIVDAAQPTDFRMQNYKYFGDFRWMESAGSLIESFSFMILRNSAILEKEMRDYGTGNDKFKAIGIKLPPEVSLSIDTRWKLSPDECEVLRAEAQQAVKKAEPQIWEFVRRQHRNIQESR